MSLGVIENMETEDNKLKLILIRIKEKLELIRQNWKPVIFAAVLLIGLLASLYLVQHPQIFKSKASSSLNSAITITVGEGKNVGFKSVDTSGVDTWQTDADSVNINIDIDKLEQIEQLE